MLLVALLPSLLAVYVFVSVLMIRPARRPERLSR
jgi:hypothetical protein